MDIEKFIQSKEVQNQSLSTEEVKKILVAFGVEEFAEYEGLTAAMLPLFKAFKAQLFDYALGLVKTEFDCPDSESKEITIFDNSDVLDITNKLLINLQNFIASELKILERSERRNKWRRNSYFHP